MLNNFWINHKVKRLATIEINHLLNKFVGRKVQPADQLFVSMRKTVLKYFTKHPEHIKHFKLNQDQFVYNFVIEEHLGQVTFVSFVA